MTILSAKTGMRSILDWWAHAVVLSVWFFAGATFSQTAPDPPTAGGSPADLELSTFGHQLQPGRASVESISGIQTFMLWTIVAMYNISNQYSQVLRLCRVLEEQAKADAELVKARNCQLSALLGLGRFNEAETLWVANGTPLAVEPVGNAAEEIRRWHVIGELARNRGEASLQAEASRHVLKIVSRVRAKPPEAAPIASTQPELREAMLSMEEFILQDAEQAALWSLLRHAYHRQEPTAHSELLGRLLTTAGRSSYSNAAGVYAMNSAAAMMDLGQRGEAAKLARQVLHMVRADAGFRDIPEPLQRFEPLPSAVVTLGDERTQRIFVQAWVRLAHAYALLGRDDEADRLLEAAHTLAHRYVLEPPAASRLIALVEQAMAQVAIWRDQLATALPLLRAARKRLLNASIEERSSSYGKRGCEWDGELLDVSARLLAVLATIQPMPMRDPAAIDEVIDIALGFSASRAESSARQAARTLVSPKPELRPLLMHEGELIDELIDLRGRLSSAIVKGRGAEADASTRRIATVLDELKELKRQMGDDASVSGSPDGRALATVVGSQVFWQWIFHPAANLTLSLHPDGLWLRRVPLTLPEISARANAVHRSASLRHVNQWSQLTRFPVEDAAQLYSALFGVVDQQPAPVQVSHWILSPPPVLDRLPWAALVTNYVAATGARPAPSWLVQHAAISLVPSLAAWHALKERPASVSKRDLLALGDPFPAALQVDPTTLSRRGAVFAAIGAAPPPSLERNSSAFAREIDAVAKLFPPGNRKVLLGPAATKSALLNLPLSEYRMLLFSTHGHLGGSISRSLGPSLELSGTVPADRFLAADEVARLRLDANLVVLSACDTSASDGYLDAEGFSGLTSAFLLAGARTVVASLWPVETTSATNFTVAAMRAYQRDTRQPFALAVREAMLSALQTSSPVERHPALWAAFVVVGL